MDVVTKLIDMSEAFDYRPQNSVAGLISGCWICEYWPLEFCKLELQMIMLNLGLVANLQEWSQSEPYGRWLGKACRKMVFLW